MATSIAPLNAFCDDTVIDGGSAATSVFSGSEACTSIDGGNPASTPDKAFGGGTP